MGAPRPRRCTERIPKLTSGDSNSAAPTCGGGGSGERWLRSYGRRKGRKLSPHQSLLLEQASTAQRIDISRPLVAGELPGIFSAPVCEVWLEIGFGAGEHLVWQVERNPEIGMIGAEPYINGVTAAMSAVETRKLEGRIKIHPDDVLALLNWLPAGSVARGFMLFPDPWPKKRHRERRLFSPATLDKLARILRANAEFRFASDIADYTEAAIAHARAHPDFELSRVFTTANRNAVPDWPATRYEGKARKEGRSATFISLRRKA